MQHGMFVIGTRPEAIKMVPIIRALREDPDPNLDPIVVVTGQHREMLDQILTPAGIVPDYDFNLMQKSQTLTEITSSVLSQMKNVLDEAEVVGVVVQGDTTTAFAAALAAYYHEIPIAHVEAGLRSGDRESPFPEEMNRRMVSQLANLDLAPTRHSEDNLLLEHVQPWRIVVTGNTVIDQLLWAVEQDFSYGAPELEHLDDDPRRVILVTCHRRESIGDGMHQIAAALKEIAEQHEDYVIVFPIHKNPKVRDVFVPVLGDLENVIICEPLEYGGFCKLMKRSYIILSDSGGIQEEAPSLDKPLLIMRENTERTEALQTGATRLAGTVTEEIVGLTNELLDNEKLYETMANAPNPFGDGKAAKRCVAAFRHAIFDEPFPDEFDPPNLHHRW